MSIYIVKVFSVTLSFLNTKFIQNIKINTVNIYLKNLNTFIRVLNMNFSRLMSSVQILKMIVEIHTNYVPTNYLYEKNPMF